MNEIVVRHWRDGDDEAVCELFDRTERWLSDEAYHRKFEDPGLAVEGVIVAEAGDRIVGHLMGTRLMVQCEGAPKRFGAIGQVMVDPEFQGLGVGKRMLQRVIEYHQGGECRGVLLWTQEDRIPAYPMYEKLGFRKVARRVQYHIELEAVESSARVEPYADADAEACEALRQEWMRICFPVDVNQLQPSANGGWHVIRRGTQPVGYLHIGGQTGEPFLIHAVARRADVPDVCDALCAHFTPAGSAHVRWQTTVGSLWDAELRRRGFYRGRTTTDVRMCLSLGGPVQVRHTYPEFDAISTW